jgi:hypothetical protein
VPSKGGGDAAEDALRLQEEDHHFLHRLSLDHIEYTLLTIEITAWYDLFLPMYEVFYYLAWLRDRPGLHHEVSFTLCDLPNFSVGHDPNNKTTIHHILCISFFC